MKNYFTVLILILAYFPSWSQDDYNPKKVMTSEELFLKQHKNKNLPVSAGQKYLAFDVAPRVGKFRRYRFFPGDQIRFRMNNEKIRFQSAITSISDSSFTIAHSVSGKMDSREIKLKEIKMIKITRRVPFVTEASYYFPIAGLLYIGADFVNKGVDDKRFTTDGSAFIVGGALMAAGFICYKLSSPSIQINDRNKLKVMETY